MAYSQALDHLIWVLYFFSASAAYELIITKFTILFYFENGTFLHAKLLRYKMGQPTFDDSDTTRIYSKFVDQPPSSSCLSLSMGHWDWSEFWWMPDGCPSWRDANQLRACELGKRRRNLEVGTLVMFVNLKHLPDSCRYIFGWFKEEVRLCCLVVKDERPSVFVFSAAGADVPVAILHVVRSFPAMNFSNKRLDSRFQT